jgi:hypothetical protein
MGLVLPGACSLACRAAGALAPRLPAAMSGRGPAVAVGALLAWSGLRALGDLRRSAPRVA